MFDDTHTLNFTFNFHAPVGQNIAHVDKIEAHFDKDMTMQVMDTASLLPTRQKERTDSPTLCSCIETLMQEKDENGNPLVSRGNHWIAIFRVIVDKGLGASSTDYQGFCRMMNALKPEGFSVPLKQENLKSISRTLYHKPLDKWQYDPVYCIKREPYDRMVSIALRFKEILEENGF